MRGRYGCVSRVLHCVLRRLENGPQANMVLGNGCAQRGKALPDRQGELITELGERQACGRRRHVDLELSASCWGSQDRMFVTAILRDITTRKLSERALRRLNQTLHDTAAERTADRDRIVATRDGSVTSINPATTLQLGASDDRLIGSNLRDLIVPRDRTRWDEEASLLLTSAAPRRFKLQVDSSDHKQRWIDWNAVASDDFFQLVGRDITSEKEPEQATSGSLANSKMKSSHSDFASLSV